MMMKERFLNLVQVLVLIFIFIGCKQTQKPNIILILADDYGYMDTQAYAQHVLGVDKDSMYYETPNLDRLIEGGIAFDQAYANQLCSPTRASILTGKYPARLGFTTATPLRKTWYNENLPVPEGSYAHDVIDHHDNIAIEQALLNGSSNTALPSGAILDDGWDETTIAEALPDYHSAFIGKWHVGGHGAEGYTPSDQGFESLAWCDAGGSAYFNWRDGWNRKSTPALPNLPQKEWLFGDAGEQTGKNYLTDDLTEQAIRYLDKRSKIKNQPFFLYFCHFAVHSPWEAKEDDISYFEGKSTRGWNGHEDASYAGMIRGLDQSVGRILDKLEQTGLDDNTLVVFMSDNGGIDRKVTPNGKITSNYPLMGGKACVTEGGVRVPLVFRWKGKLEEGKWCKETVDCNDIFPTIVEAAGYDVQQYYSKQEGIDGRSLMGLVNDIENTKNTYDRNIRYWHYPFNVIYNNPYDGLPLTPHSAIREGDYKLIFDWHGRLKLFNLAKDISETSNLAKEMPDKTNELFGKLMEWLKAEVKPTYWPKTNPDYTIENEAHNVPYVDLVKIYNERGDVAIMAN